MGTHRATLTPQMSAYDDFDDRGETEYQPYLMFFHRPGYRSDVVNTDRYGFRVSHGEVDGSPASASAAGARPPGPVRLLAGTSTALGLGATSDAATMASRLWSEHAPSRPWLNFAGRSHSSAQEALLLALNQHLLPEVDEVVLLSGFNNLAASRFPAQHRGAHGGYFFCGEFFEAMGDLRERHRSKDGALSRLLGRGAGSRSGTETGADGEPAEAEPEVRGLDEYVAEAAELTGRHLQVWQRLLGPDVPLTYVLQPLATWWRDVPAEPEQLLFDEIDRTSRLGTWEQLYGDISSPEAGRRYASALAEQCQRIGVRFLDLNVVLAQHATGDDWLYVDRAHLTDHGNDVCARLLAEQLSLT